MNAIKSQYPVIIDINLDVSVRYQFIAYITKYLYLHCRIG